MSDPGTTYRSRDEVDHMRENNDPLKVLAQTLLQEGVVTEKEIKDIEQINKDIVDKATVAALADPEPPLGDLGKDIYEAPKENPRGLAPKIF